MAGHPYHHGDLAPALVRAGVELARTHGPEGVVLRAVTRAVRVSPTAAYRHFADRESLLLAVGAAARDLLADAMEAALAPLPARPTSPRRARARLAAIGRAYVRFALDEPGLFRTAFAGVPAVPPDQGPDRAFAVLVQALDGLVEAGALSARNRRGADIAAWSAVHGLATLMLGGVVIPPGADPTPIIDRVQRMVLEGL